MVTRTAAALLVGVVCAGCGAAADGARRGVSVVTTTTQLTDFARVVGGRHVTVHGLLKANVDPHDYEASPADLEIIRQADVVVKNGLGLEAWFERTIKSASPEGYVVDASRGARTRRGDPHLWLDPRNAEVMVGNIADALVEADPTHEADYRANERAYTGRVRALDAQIASALGALRNKRLVTNHDAFGYYVDRFGLELVGSVIPSFDTQAELSARGIDDLVSKAKRSGVKAIFAEMSVPPKTARAIAREAGVEVVAGDDALYGDTLGPPGSDGATYLAMMRHNTKEIVDHLR